MSEAYLFSRCPGRYKVFEAYVFCLIFFVFSALRQHFCLSERSDLHAICATPGWNMPRDPFGVSRCKDPAYTRHPCVLRGTCGWNQIRTTLRIEPAPVCGGPVRLRADHGCAREIVTRSEGPKRPRWGPWHADGCHWGRALARELLGQHFHFQ